MFLTKSNVFLQRREKTDIGALQPSAKHILLCTSYKAERPSYSFTESISEGSFVYIIAMIRTTQSPSPKDFFAMHSAVCATSIKAVPLFTTRGSILHKHIFRAGLAYPTAVLRKVTHTPDGSAERPGLGECAVCAACFCITDTRSSERTEVVTARVAIALLEGAAVALLPSFHFFVSTTIACHRSVVICHVSLKHTSV